jgi:hypothetical protein
MAANSRRSYRQGRRPTRSLVRVVQMASVMLLVAGACQANPAPRTAGPDAAGVGSPEATLTPTLATSSPSATQSPSCDPVDQLFANMFVGLSEAALSNAGITRERFLAALANDRATLKKYLKALNMPVDDASIDAEVSANVGQRLLTQILAGGSFPPSDGIVCR